MNRMQRLKEEYRSIRAPERLTEVFDAARGCAASSPSRGWHFVRWAAAAVCCLFLCFTVALNLFPSFAAALDQNGAFTPLVQILTISKTNLEEDSKGATVVQGSVTGLADEALSDQLNSELAGISDGAIEQVQTLLADEAPLFVNSTYETKFSSDRMLSFLVYVDSSSASTENQVYCYNIDLEKNEVLTLSDLLAEQQPDYIDTISAEIREEILTSPESDFFYDENGALLFETIEADQSYYINTDEQLVIVFDQFAIAPGSMGTPEFIVDSVSVAPLLEP